jgi:hypothetical protein
MAPKAKAQKAKTRVELHQIKKPLHSKANSQQNETVNLQNGKKYL